jgi:hypothetical protein
MRDIQDSIIQLQGEKFLNNHKKTLLFSLLDTMSKGVYGNRYHRNHKRFENFIKEFCVWEDGNRVSLQQLSLLLERTEEQDYLPIKYYVNEKLSKFPLSKPVSFNYDPTIEELKVMLEGEEEIKNVKIEKLTHVGLLWLFRNSLVHEARGIGANELFDEVEPHYILYKESERNSEGITIIKKYWQKLYPLQFFIDLVNQAISNIEPYLIQNEINPYNNYNFDPLWIEVRN